MDKEVMNCVIRAERYLAIREHNRAELNEKLKQKNYSQKTVDNALEYLIQNGELSEQRYIDAFVRSNNSRHPENKAIVFQRLIQKGADKDLSREILNGIYTEEFTQSLLEKAFEKECLHRNPDTEMLKIEQKLVKAGFSLSMIRRLEKDLK